MNSDFIKSKPVNELADITYTMWSLGWDEKNGGNVSYILNDNEIKKIRNLEKESIIPLKNIPQNLVGKHLLITASGSNFRVLKNDLESFTGVIKLVDEGYIIKWGFENDNKPTSEIYMHLLSHSARLEVDPNHRVVVHNHATDVSKMTFVHDLDEDAFTRSLWGMITECIVVFPDGVSVLPWMVCGNEEIGLATAEKLRNNRIVVWSYHGILATGSDFEDAFGLIETVNKAASIYVDSIQNRINDGISDEGLWALCEHFNVSPKEGILKK